MATILEHLCVFFLFLFLLHNTRGKQTICDSMSCGDIDIQFPFGLKGSNQDPRCSYRGFQVSCDNRSQTILNLPDAGGDWVVKSINYEDQSILVNDPDGCLPKRFLHNLNFWGSPLVPDPIVYGFFNLTFLRCSAEVMGNRQVSCLSDSKGNSSSNSSVIVSWSRPIVSSPLSEFCEVISSDIVPLPNEDMPMWPFGPDLTSDIKLVWSQPRCGNCAASGYSCGFAMDTGLRVECFPSIQKESQGLPRSAKYGLALGVGIPGLSCLIGLCCFICGKVSKNTHRRRPSTELPTTIPLERTPFVMGLDGATIEKYPKTLLGESGRLLKPSDNTCSICLSEYEPKETLRTIPECNHYFHAHCIDEWLKMNSTCPLCRKSPEASSGVAPSFSSLSPTSSLSSST